MPPVHRVAASSRYLAPTVRTCVCGTLVTVTHRPSPAPDARRDPTDIPDQRLPQGLPAPLQRGSGLPAGAWHGTSTAVLSRLRETGQAALRSPHLTNRWDVAVYYAEVTAEEDGSEPVVLEVGEVPGDLLRYDAAAVDEPVLCDADEVSEGVDRVAREHPEWVSPRPTGDLLMVPSHAWEVSWELVGCARVVGDLPWRATASPQ